MQAPDTKGCSAKYIYPPSSFRYSFPLPFLSHGWLWSPCRILSFTCVFTYLHFGDPTNCSVGHSFLRLVSIHLPSGSSLLPRFLASPLQFLVGTHCPLTQTTVHLMITFHTLTRLGLAQAKKAPYLATTGPSRQVQTLFYPLDRMELCRSKIGQEKQ